MKTPVTSSVDMIPPDLTVPVMFGPNITGEAGRTTAGGTVSGAFSRGATSRGDFDSDGSSGPMTFSAEDSSSVFGSSSTVQPPAVRFLPLIKS